MRLRALAPAANGARPRLGARLVQKRMQFSRRLHAKIERPRQAADSFVEFENFMALVKTSKLQHGAGKNGATPVSKPAIPKPAPRGRSKAPSQDQLSERI